MARPSIIAATTSPAHRLLSEAHIPFDYVDLDRPLKMGNARMGDTAVLMLNAIGKLPAAKIREVLSWVKKGGNLIVTGRGDVTDALPDLKLGQPITIADTSTFAGRTPVAYVRADRRPGGDEWSIGRGYSPVLSYRGWKPIAWVLPQAVYRSGWEFDQSHRPSIKPSGPAALYRKIGRGAVIYFNHEPFADSIDRGVNLFRDIPAACLKYFGLAPQFEVHGCQSIEANYYSPTDSVPISAATLPESSGAMLPESSTEACLTTRKPQRGANRSAARNPSDSQTLIVLTNGFVGTPLVANGDPGRSPR